jgi:hypothetical protein
MEAILASSVDPTPSGGARISFDGTDSSPLFVSPGFVFRFRPKKGGYLVVMDDGNVRWMTKRSLEDLARELGQ